jgi:hypothetical protein
MIVIRLIGGLGNQIFQVGAALLLASKSGENRIIIDDSFLNSYDSKRKNELLEFFNFEKLDIEIIFKKSYLVKFRIPKVLPLKLIFWPFISDSNFQFTLKNQRKQFLLLDGYFQWILLQKDFNEIVNILKTIFIKNDTSIINSNYCVVHIRGGDFVKLGWNVLTPESYYIESINFMKEKHDINNFVIVTDDEVYAKSVLCNLKFNFDFISSDIKTDFYTISKYSNRILSASTFALWASSLGKNEEGIVIAPAYWFPNKKREINLPNEIKIKGVSI